MSNLKATEAHLKMTSEKKSCQTNTNLHDFKYGFSESEQTDILKNHKCTQTEVILKNQCNHLKKETIEEFVKKILRINQEDVDQEMPVDNGYEKRTRRKIESGSYPNGSVNEKKLPKLLRYVWKGKLKKVKMYLANPTNRAKINAVDSLGRSPLHFAASWDCLKVMQCLLENGAKVNMRDSQGKTPLHKAVEIRSKQCVKVLMENGSDINIKAHDDRTPFDFSLQEYGDDEIDMIKSMFEGVKQSICQERTISYLHKLCLAKRNISLNKVVEMLLDIEDVNAIEGLGRTPLMLAAKTKRKDLIKILLLNNADVMRFDTNYKTALHFVEENTEEYDMLKNAMVKARQSIEAISSPSVKIKENQTFDATKMSGNIF